MADRTLPPTPRVVRFSALYFGVLKAQVAGIMLLAILMIGIGYWEFSSYRKLMEHGQVVQTVVSSKREITRRAHIWYLSYPLPSDPSGELVESSVPYRQYVGTEIGQALTLTVDPENPRHHVVGLATGAHLENSQKGWEAGLLGVISMGFSVTFMTWLTAQVQKRQLTNWEFHSAPILYVGKRPAYTSTRQNTRRCVRVTLSVPDEKNPTRVLMQDSRVSAKVGHTIEVLFEAGAKAGWGVASAVRPNSLRYVTLADVPMAV